MHILLPDKAVVDLEKSFLLERDGLKIPCKLSEPVTHAPRKIVLGVHGFGGSTNDEIQVGIAEEMRLFGAAVLRFDFPAHGQSPMTDKDYTLKNCVETLLAAARHAREQYPDVEDLCILMGKSIDPLMACGKQEKKAWTDFWLQEELMYPLKAA